MVWIGPILILKLRDGLVLNEGLNISNYSLNGPEVTQPPPVPGSRCMKHGPAMPSHGKQDEFLPGIYSPSPDMLPTLPSKNGPFFGSPA
jgi:hypothetical protein